MLSCWTKTIPRVKEHWVQQVCFFSGGCMSFGTRLLVCCFRYKTVYFPTNLFFSGSQSSIWKVSNFSLQFLVVFWFADSWTFHSPAVGINTATYRHFSVPSSSETVIRWVLSVCLHSSVNWTSSATNNF